jgi:alkanesulfonate monooxygenase SsuD/methylene tetrahydromethanopterin reductase-like flavin-dependent oxidoreductase (luciferase family)
MFTLRFHMRAPKTGAPAVELYEAALEIAAWAETRGALAAVLCEHHSSPDGYLPSPLILASAMAARTQKLFMMVAIFTAPLYNPVRLAEEMVVLDIISKGRVAYTGGLGYLPYEYDMLGVDFKARGRIADDYLELLLKAVKGEPFTHQGRKIHVTPAPYTPGGPKIGWGGGSIAAAKRAGRFGVDMFAQKDDPALKAAFDAACKEHGHTPGACVQPPQHMPSTVFVSDDLDEAWAEIGPYLMHDVLSYAAWNEGNTDTSSLSFVRTAEELRAEKRSHQILTVAEAVAFIKAGAPLTLHPLIGGLPPKLAWKYLHNVVDKVMPALATSKTNE